MVAQAMGGHGRALDVPTRPSQPPGGPPTRLTRLGGFPKHKIKRIPLCLVHRHPFPGAKILQMFTRQLAIGGKFAHRIVDIPVVRHIGDPLLHQALNHLDDLLHVAGSAWLHRRRQHTQCLDIPVHLVNETGGQ